LWWRSVNPTLVSATAGLGRDYLEGAGHTVSAVVLPPVSGSISDW